MNYEEVISRVHVYGLEESVRGSKYPMATDLGKISEDVTPTVVKLATSKQFYERHHRADGSDADQQSLGGSRALPFPRLRIESVDDAPDYEI